MWDKIKSEPIVGVALSGALVAEFLLAIGVPAEIAVVASSLIFCFSRRFVLPYVGKDMMKTLTRLAEDDNLRSTVLHAARSVSTHFRGYK